MATLEELRKVRLEKLEKLKELGINPYPADSHKTHDNLEIIQNFQNLENKNVTVTGRATAIRSHNKLTFIDLKDWTGKVQLYIKEEQLKGDKNGLISYDNLNLLDLGDFIEATGVVTKTQRGEISILVESVRLLTKSLRPLPDKWEGLKDKETRLRRRYLDTNINKEVFNRYIRRSKFWQIHREFFKEKGFLEINIPVLENIPGGADAKPFITHMEAIDQDFFLRISQELYLKRLIGGGYEKVFEIGPRFRNEGWSDEHLPEHMAMEFYWAYADWKEGMKMIQDLFDRITDEVYEGKKVFEIRGHTVDFSKGWETIDFAEVMKKRFGIDVHNTTVEEVAKTLEKHHIKGDFDINVPRGIDYLWKDIRKDISGPAFLINHPKFMSPLSKSHPEAEHITERFQPIIAGSELGNGWSEINDPLDQLERFMEQQDLREAGDEEAQWLDIDYVEMLEYGMPPTFGYGHSERVFWFLEDVSAREGVPFPQLKHDIDETTRKIYGLPEVTATKIPVQSEAESNSKSETAPSENKKTIEGTGKGSKELTKDAALEILHTHMQNENLRRHCYAVGKALAAYYDFYNSENRDLGSLTKEQWEIVGILHDSDWELTANEPEKHTIMLLEWLKDYEVPEEMLEVFMSHNNKITKLRDPETLLEWTLECCDELTGFIVAVALVSPSRKIDEVTVERVLKKFKQKEFARAVEREQIKQCEEKVNVSLEDFIGVTLRAMQDEAELMGL